MRETVHVFINKAKYEFDNAQQTGRSLKERAGIPLEDALFFDEPHEDKLITNETTISIKNGDHFHSQPAANYGSPHITAEALGAPTFEVVPQPGGWTFVVVKDFMLPETYVPAVVKLLVKLPPTFPDGAPDMFWTEPSVRLKNGGAPQGTAMEPVLGESWMRFSWHLVPGAWRPGISTLRDFMRCVRARFAKSN